LGSYLLGGLIAAWFGAFCVRVAGWVVEGFSTAKSTAN
jgi:hypothetical protein